MEQTRDQEQLQGKETPRPQGSRMDGKAGNKCAVVKGAKCRQLWCLGPHRAGETARKPPLGLAWPGLAQESFLGQGDKGRRQSPGAWPAGCSSGRGGSAEVATCFDRKRPTADGSEVNPCTVATSCAH